MASVYKFCAAHSVPKSRHISAARKSSTHVVQRRLFQSLQISGWVGELQINQAPSRVCGKRVTPARAALEELLNNQVLKSTLTATVLGQLAKPFTSLLSGKGFNWKIAFKSGGMPSTHSAGVTAAATSLGLERGLSDSVFGLAVVVASIVMYDAQGVRNAAGKHAQLLNSIVLTYFPDRLKGVSKTEVPNNVTSTAIGIELANDPVAQEISFMDNAVLPYSLQGSPKSGAKDEQPEFLVNNQAFTRPQSFFETVTSLPAAQRGEVYMQEIERWNGWRQVPLKETIGHTKLEVVCGGILGVLITLALHASTK